VLFFCSFWEHTGAALIDVPVAALELYAHYFFSNAQDVHKQNKKQIHGDAQFSPRTQNALLIAQNKILKSFIVQDAQI
jgi:hypothetical protein